MKKKACALAAAVFALSVGAPVWAHEEISPASVPTGKPAYLILSAANEKRVDLTRVAIAAPSGGEFGHATRDPAGWTATFSHTAVTWSGGAVRPGRFEQFGFDIQGFSQPGTFTYRVTLGYADGSSNEVEVPVTAGDAAPASPASPASPAVASPTPTTAAAPVTTVAQSDDGSSDGLAMAALGLGVLSLLLAVAAMLQARKALRPGADRAPAATVSAGEDW